MTINGTEFKKYDSSYYVSKNGEVYSLFSKRLLKHSIDHDGYHRVDIHGKHIKVHKLVYITWCGNIPDGMQINHIDDNKDNNNYTNLYAGTQKENIDDCFANNHRVGNTTFVMLINKYSNQIEIYESAKEFIATTGHSARNGSFKKISNRNWFKEQYEILCIGRSRGYRKPVVTGK